MTEAEEALTNCPAWMLSSFDELSKHLQKQKICGFDKPYNELFPVIFYFKDGSIILINGHSAAIYKP